MIGTTSATTDNRAAARRGALTDIPLLTHGFRPFFLGAASFAALAMVVWIGAVTGHLPIAERYGAVAWHAHEFLFGYVSGVMTGFLLTAVPNWTGRLPVRGGLLLGLLSLWVAARIAMIASDWTGLTAAIVIDAAYPFVLAAVILREIVAGKNWRNLKTVGLVTLFAAANLTFHLELLWSGSPQYGIRIGVAAVIALIMLIGGRIVPSFTRNWLVREGSTKLPAPFDRFDGVALAVAGLALLAWVLIPDAAGTGLLLLAAATAQLGRLARWAGERTWREPLVLVLHLGYAFIPLGFLTLGVSALLPDWLPASAALHAWTTGAVGVMTLAVMTRASLGHTGQALTAGPATSAIYAAVIVAALARVAVAFAGPASLMLLTLAAIAWIAAFALFVATYGPLLATRRR